MLYKITNSLLKRMAPEVPSGLEKTFPWAPMRAARSKTSAVAATTRDGAEVGLLRGWLMFAGGLVLYTVSAELVSPQRASFFNVDVRGDIDRQMAAAERAAEREGRAVAGGGGGGAAPLTSADPAAASYAGGKHTMWWRLAQVKNDAARGPNIGVLPWDNRVAGTASSCM